MAIDRVCSSCFGDPDLRTWVRDNSDGRRGCDACGGYDSSTVQLSEICEYIEECIKKFWGLAVEQLPYESAEGGYQGGATWDTYEVVDDLCLDLPRDDNGNLSDAIKETLPDEIWCEWDWLSLDEDVALQNSWEHLCETVKHERRFFFHKTGGSPDDRDAYSAVDILHAIANLSEQLGLIKSLPINTKLWRARPDIPLRRRSSPSDYGPPPRERALQSNRMNPPGIPMMYVASTATTALMETRAETARVGLWRNTRPTQILDLRNLYHVPGIFSSASRRQILGLSFLTAFAKDIMVPVERDKRVHVDYLPSQVVTEFLRDYEFEVGYLDGIAYPSVVNPSGWNLALFIGDMDIAKPDSWLQFVADKRVSV